MQTYFRQKRIQRIEMIRSNTDSSWANRKYQYQTTLTWLKFSLHLAILFCLVLACSTFMLSMPSVLASAIRPILAISVSWLSVEIHDYIWLNYYKQIKIILNAVCYTIAFLILIVILLIYFQGSGEGSLIQVVQNWHQQVNQDLQRSSAEKFKILGASGGQNWQFVLNPKNQPDLLTAIQVKRICQDRFGAGWRLPKTNELSAITPYPNLLSPTYVWALNKRDGINLNLTSLSQTPAQSGQVFVSYNATDIFPALCIQESR